jgi:predicted nucleic acid-binding protein
MILYLDTSALVKRYFQEPFSDEVVLRWKASTEIVISSVAYAETLASFYRKKREVGLKEAAARKLIEAFRLEWKSFIRVEVNDELDEYLDRALARYPLRGFDAIHLASAVLVRESLRQDILFVCFDQVLARAARKEGFETFPHNAG